MIFVSRNESLIRAFFSGCGKRDYGEIFLMERVQRKQLY